MGVRTVPGIVLAAAMTGVVMTAAAQNSVHNPQPVSPVNLVFADTAVQWSSESEMHGRFVERFRQAVGLGRTRMSNSDMRIHDRMTLTTVVPRDEGAPDGVTMRYRLRSLELIGIARHQTPMAFVLGSHGALGGASQRELTGFEQAAVTRLRAGVGDVVTQTERTARLVVGAVRAEAGCTRCHAAFKVGDLLGAFSYRLLLEGRARAGGATDTGSR